MNKHYNNNDKNNNNNNNNNNNKFCFGSGSYTRVQIEKWYTDDTVTLTMIEIILQITVFTILTKLKDIITIEILVIILEMIIHH